MKVPRIYSPTPLVVGTEVTLQGDRHHYLAHVLRLSASGQVILFNAAGEFHCCILESSRRFSRLICERKFASLPVSSLRVTLYVCLSKSRSMDLAMQKATELGVTTIRPVSAARSVVSVSAGERKLLHWRSIARGACEQCGRSDVPEITAPISFKEIVASADAVAFVLDPDSERSLPSMIRSLPESMFAVLIGPEGGLTEGEVRAAEEKGFVPVSLGPRLMRVETALTAAISVLHAFLGDFAGSKTSGVIRGVS